MSISIWVRFLSLSSPRLCGILEGGVPGHPAHYIPPQSGPGHEPHGAGHQPGLLPIHYSLSCQTGTGIKRNYYSALPSPNSIAGAKVKENQMEREQCLGEHCVWGNQCQPHPPQGKGSSDLGVDSRLQVHGGHPWCRDGLGQC